MAGYAMYSNRPVRIKTKVRKSKLTQRQKDVMRFMETHDIFGYTDETTGEYKVGAKLKTNVTN